MNRKLKHKYNNLKKLISGLDSAIVAFSGGVDSALVLKIAHDILSNLIAVTADSPSVPRNEIKQAKRIAKEIGARHIIIKTQEMENRDYIKNPANRCYFCKSELYSKLRIVAQKYEIKNILNGTNFDDVNDYRPGLLAAEEYRVISPLKDAKLTKNDVRDLAKNLGISIWDKPASPCLASRVPYEHEITLRKLRVVEEAENFLKESFLIKELRVRHFGGKARIEVNKQNFELITQNFELIKDKFNLIGFKEIELREFKSGSLNLYSRTKIIIQ